MLKKILIAIGLFLICANSVYLILEFLYKKQTIITKIKLDICKMVETKYRRIAAVIMILIISIVFSKYYQSLPIATGIGAGIFWGIVIFFKEESGN